MSKKDAGPGTTKLKIMFILGRVRKKEVKKRSAFYIGPCFVSGEAK
jgi:hypothetical protein